MLYALCLPNEMKELQTRPLCVFVRSFVSPPVLSKQNNRIKKQFQNPSQSNKDQISHLLNKIKVGN
jgi:hypothetical protein